MSSSVSELLSSPVSAREFSPEDVLFFQEQGFVVARGLVNSVWLDRMRLVTREHLERELPPVEFEAEVHYPGAPDSLDAPGGRTVRRLKQALTRDIVFTEWVCQLDIVRRLEQLLGGRVVMPLAHHNCIMTKQPEHSSETGWHQDVRYWNFTRPDLVSCWLALGTERPENGCLWVIPGSHRGSLERSRLDEALFVRKDHPENQALLDAAIPVALAPGDVLFFHAKTLHSASKNQTTATKYSVVFTFRGADNPPIAGTRSAVTGELLLPASESLSEE